MTGEVGHAEARWLLNLAADGPISDAEASQLEEHLASCDACRAYAAELERLKARIAGTMHARWPARGPSVDIVPGVLRRVRRQTMTRRVISAAVGAALVLGVLLVTVFLFHSIGDTPVPGSIPVTATVPATPTIGATSPASGTAPAKSTLRATTTPLSTGTLPPATAPQAAPTVEASPGGGPVLTSLSMFAGGSGWALAGSRVLRTVDGGAHWTDVTPTGVTPVQDPYQSQSAVNAFFLNADQAWVATKTGPAQLVVIHTGDAGRTWDFGAVPTTDLLGGPQLSFADARTGWMLLHGGVAAGSEGAALFATTDGNSWSQIAATNPATPEANGLPFGGNKNGVTVAGNGGWLAESSYATGQVALFRSTDGGRTWALQPVPIPVALQECQTSALPPRFFSPSDGILPVQFLCGTDRLVVYHSADGGANWSASFPAPDSGVYDFATPQDGWVAASSPGSHGLSHTSDGGQTWQSLQTSGGPQQFEQLDFVDARTGWALGDGQLFQTTDGGRTWAGLRPSY